ncbi:hypothetical protein CW735_12310 [Alteromonas sp. MB-3u-76]|uniref:hypothetical protein n=1 Tax=Alteromonas sp. MB-3u-76 TaxID=2058133 RepID=UPI000C314BF0|nr:hypothetical protein [Alteromonas sp. MB-3u-76]AUC88872.1 hypothetical protein CW735_12310 [Alteromonas sp. MB-3u-76]
MEIKKNNDSTDVLKKELRKSAGGFAVFADFCSEYEAGKINELTVDNLYEILKPMLEDELCNGEKTQAKEIRNLSAKYLKANRTPHKQPNPAEEYRKGMSIAITFNELRRSGTSYEEALRLAGEKEAVGEKRAEQYKKLYEEKAKKHVNEVKKRS